MDSDIANLKTFSLKQYPGNQFQLSSSVLKSKLFFDFSYNYIRLNKRVEEKEISSKSFSLFIGVVSLNQACFFLFAEYV